VHRLLTTLEQERFVRFDREHATWLVGVEAFTFGSGFVHSRDIVTIARPFLRMLMEESGETVNLAIHDGYRALYMSQVESRHMVRVIANPGERVHLHCSAVGKVLLAYMPESDLAKALQELQLPRLTGKTIATISRLRAELETVRINGYSLDDEEHTADVRCIAAAIFSEHCLPAAAVSLSGPKMRIANDRIQALGALVHRVGGQITAEFGGRLPSMADHPGHAEHGATSIHA
jgi:IclR family acetate operon transcriptional repressor